MTRKDVTALDSVQYLRAILVFLVVMDHAGILISLEKYFGVSLIAPSINYFGVVGVNIFFMISGFIIIYTATEKSSLSLVVSIPDFVKKRAVRLIPIMWVSIVSYAVLKRLGRGEWGEVNEYLTAFFLYPFSDINPTQLWTLRHEVYFYLVFALSMYFRRLWILLVGVWIFLPLWFYNQDSAVLSFFFSPFAFLFGVGVFACILRKKIIKHLDVKKSNGLAAFLMFFGCVLVAYSCHVFEYTHKHIISIMVFAVIASPIIFFTVMLPVTIDGFFGKVLKLFGDASYSIYLFHGIFLSAIIGILSRYKEYINKWAAFSISVSLAMVLGVLVYLLIEKRLVTYLRTRFYL